MTMPLNRRRYSRWRLRRMVDKANLPGLSSRSAGNWSRSDQIPSVSARNTSSTAERVGARIGLELLVFEACQCRGAQALAKHDLLDCQNALEHRDIDAGPETPGRCPSATSARFRAGGVGPVRIGTTCR